MVNLTSTKMWDNLTWDNRTLDNLTLDNLTWDNLTSNQVFPDCPDEAIYVFSRLLEGWLLPTIELLGLIGDIKIFCCH